MPAPALDDLPLRAQCGYVCKYSSTKHGELTPGMICGILRAKGVLDDDTDPEGVKAIAAEVLEHHRSRGENT